jgi:hypothetical protein
MLLQAGQLLSHFGSQTSSIAYPLLVLATTHSPAKAGVVGFVRYLANALFSLPAGVAADRWSRRRLMIAADGVRLVALGGLVALILLDTAAFWSIAFVAFVEGSGGAVFAAARAGAVRAVVPAPQLPAAVAVQTGRQAAMNVAGPPIGGALFGLARALPFVVDSVSYAFSALSLLTMRTPFQESREPDPSSLRSRLVEGFHFLWSNQFLRACAFLFGLTNFFGPGLMLALVVIGTRQGLSGGEVGVLVAAFSAFVLLGSFLSPAVRRVLPVRPILLLEFWAWLGCAAFLIWPSVYVLTAGLLPAAIAIPSSDSVVHGYRIAMTPDRLLGRTESVWSAISLLTAPFGPLLAGLLLGAVSARATIGFFAAFVLALAVWGTVSPSIRAAPSLDRLDALPELDTSAERSADGHERPVQERRKEPHARRGL